MVDAFKDRIDVHFHYLSPEYREKMIDAVGNSPDGFAAPQWNAEAALEMTERSHILYGSDYVRTPEAVVAAHLSELLTSKLLSPNDFRAIGRDNALFPVSAAALVD
jgi:predicted TIM-barrel fold metal-dependent hydrolase